MMLPLYTLCEANENVQSRRQAIARSKRRKAQRKAIAKIMPYVLRALWAPRALLDLKTVRMTRLSPGTLDERGNLESAFKSVRDEIATAFGVGDAPRDPIVWECRQHLNTHYGVVIEFLTC